MKIKMNELGFEGNHLRFLVKETLLYHQTNNLFEMTDTLNKDYSTPLLSRLYTLL